MRNVVRGLQARRGTYMSEENEVAADAGEPPVVIGPREQLFHLLAEAAEIEHALMCSYLYAAFSLKQGTDTGLTAQQADAVARWRKAVLAVATEEMVHLVLVSNLSIALGGRPHFSRPNFPVAPGYFPSGVVVRLTPFTTETLDHFVFLERPQGEDQPDGEGFEHAQDYAREEAYHGLMPSVQDYTTVGHLYKALRLNLLACSRRLGESELFVGPAAAQVGPEQMDLQGIQVITDLASALQAIDTIVEQGEGSRADRDGSHYQRFLSIRDEYRQLLSKDAEFAPAWPAAVNPVSRRPPEPEDKVFIDDRRAARVLDFANAVYGQLLRFLVQSFGGRDTSAPLQARSLSAAVDLMHVLARTGSALARMPASAEAPGVNAGMTFTMLRSVEPLLGSAAERLLAERFVELAHGAAVAAHSNPALNGLQQVIEKVIRDFLAPAAADTTA